MAACCSHGVAARSGFIARLRANDEARLLACWLLLPLVVFMLARSRLPLYLLPLFVPLALIAARALAPLDLSRARERKSLLAAWCVALVLARAIPAFIDVPEDDRALARALLRRAAGAPNEVAFVETDPRYGLRFYLDSEIERLELPGDGAEAAGAGHPERDARARRLPRAARQRIGTCRVWRAFLAQDSVTYKRLRRCARLRGDCAGDAGLRRPYFDSAECPL